MNIGMKKYASLFLIALLLLLQMPVDAEAQSDSGITLPPVGNAGNLDDYGDRNTGFWIAGQINAAYSLYLKDSNRPYTEIDVTGGYRFNEYLKAGVGFGGRYYIDGSRLRHDDIDWSFPLYVNIRGNIIHDGYNTVVPYYSVDMGGAIRDGFFWRPTIGIRVGQPRSAFLLGLTYTGQSLKDVSGGRRYASFLGLTLGYEY